MKEIKVLIFKPIQYKQITDVDTIHSKSQTYKTINDDLNEFYKIIECDTIDIVKRKIGNKYYCVICDDEALLKDSQIISLANRSNPYENIYGNIIITGEEDQCGELTSLSINDANEISRHIQMVILQSIADGSSQISEAIVV